MSDEREKKYLVLYLANKEYPGWFTLQGSFSEKAAREIAVRVMRGEAGPVVGVSRVIVALVLDVLEEPPPLKRPPVWRSDADKAKALEDADETT